MKQILIILFVITTSVGFTQELDSMVLEEIVFEAPKFTKYSAGAKLITLKKSDHTTNLNDAMAQLPSVTFKNYGNAGLSTISFRGTSASHTQLLWNGILVNSPTLGQSDFSLFPVYMMDEISVQYGSTSALTGSGAIGGMVSMDNKVPVFSKKTQTNVTIGYGSFGRIFTGVKSQYGGRKIQGKTKFYRRSIQNDFPFPEKGSNRELIQGNAAVHSYGMEQQVHAKLTSTQLLSITGFYNFNNREIQPNVASNGNNETLQDDNTRLVATYNNYSKFGFLETKLGYVFNDQLYNKTSRIRSEQWSYLLNLDKDLSKFTNIRAGLSHQYIIPKTNSHVIKAKENRAELYASIKQQMNRKWVVNLNLRQAIYDGELVPFTPSFGQEFTFGIGKSEFVLKNRIGRAYRIPTLNDRYWIQGGNPDIKPEQSWNFEVGGKWSTKGRNFSLTSEITVFHQSVNNWIQWTENVNIWSPENIQRGQIDGLELMTVYELSAGEHRFDINANYSLTRSIIKEDLSKSFINNFLPYVAQHNARITSTWKMSDWSNTLSMNYTGKMYIEKTNDEFQAIEGFVLINYKVTRTLAIMKVNLDLALEMNNILNIYYEQLKNHAMPGRNYAINLSINI